MSLSRTERRVAFGQLLSQLIVEAAVHGVRVAVFWYNRTSEQQAALYAIGRTIELHRKPVTNCDGVNIHSKHERWEAADLCVIDPNTNEWYWGRRAEYELLGRIAKEIGLRWGGDWDGDEERDPNDYDIYHFEYKEPT